MFVQYIHKVARQWSPTWVEAAWMIEAIVILDASALKDCAKQMSWYGSQCDYTVRRRRRRRRRRRIAFMCSWNPPPLPRIAVWTMRWPTDVTSFVAGCHSGKMLPFLLPSSSSCPIQDSVTLWPELKLKKLMNVVLYTKVHTQTKAQTLENGVPYTSNHMRVAQTIKE